MEYRINRNTSGSLLCCLNSYVVKSESKVQLLDMNGSLSSWIEPKPIIKQYKGK